MSQKVNPNAFRRGIVLDFLSKWFTPLKKIYRDTVADDLFIRHAVAQLSPNI